MHTYPQPGGPATDLTSPLADRVDALWPRYRDALRDLVRSPSVLGAETPAQHLVASLADAAGLDVDVWDVDPADLAQDERYAPVDGGSGIRPNVTAVLPGRGGGRSIAVSGHIDVVSPEPRVQWTHDPFGADVVGDRLYGRGALDMKGGLVAGLLAVHAVREAYGALAGDVVFESVIEEECSGNGTLAARRHGPAVDAALIPEISGEDVQIANTGVVWFEVTVTGKPAYVGLAGESVNAVEVAIDLARALRTLPDAFNAAPRHPVYAHVERPYTLNLGVLSGGDWPSNVPLECRIGARLSFPPDWPVERAQQAVVHALEAYAAADPWLSSSPPRLRWNGFRAHGFTIDADHPLVARLRTSVEQVTGAPARLSPMFGTADARYFADDGIPAVYFGPAGGGMHAPDEWVDLSSVHRVAHVLARTVVEWSGDAAGSPARPE
jgi:acetylornithine deacetylase